MVAYEVDDIGALRKAGKAAWIILLLFGLAMAVVGILLLANLSTAAFTLAVLVGIGFVLSGLVDLFTDRYGSRGVSVTLGLISVAAGIAAIVWPGVTLWALALIVGAGFVLAGLVRLAAAFSGLSGGARTWAIVSGVLSLVVGVVALFWPHATVVVLSVLFGIRVLAFGIIEIVAAFAIRGLLDEALPAT